jgi:hypothetical protein
MPFSWPAVASAAGVGMSAAISAGTASNSTLVEPASKPFCSAACTAGMSMPTPGTAGVTT